MFILKIASVIISILFTVSISLAEEKEAAAENDAKKDEAPKSSMAAWIPIENKIQELHAKMKSKEANILKLIEDKNRHANNTPQVKNTVKEIVKEHKELQKLAEDYQKNVALLKYRFPERNASSQRTYDRFDVKSIEEMEQNLGVDGKLNRNLKRMRSQFKAQGRDIASTPEKAPAHKKKDDKKEKSIEEAGSVILQK